MFAKDAMALRLGVRRVPVELELALIPAPGMPLPRDRNAVKRGGDEVYEVSPDTDKPLEGGPAMIPGIVVLESLAAAVANAFKLALAPPLALGPLPESASILISVPPVGLVQKRLELKLDVGLIPLLPGTVVGTGDRAPTKISETHTKKTMSTRYNNSNTPDIDLTSNTQMKRMTRDLKSAL